MRVGAGGSALRADTYLNFIACCVTRAEGEEEVGSESRPTSSADPGDFDSFVDAFVEESPGADLNLDASVDSGDVELFFEAYDELGGGQ